jgi:hypothetical protein
VVKAAPKTFTFEDVVFEDVKDGVKSKLKITGGASISTLNNEKWKKSGAKIGFIVTSVMGPNGRFKISGADDLVRVLRQNEGEEIVLLGVFPNGQEYYFEITID